MVGVIEWIDNILDSLEEDKWLLGEMLLIIDMVDFDYVDFGYESDKLVFKDIDLIIYCGEWIVLIGESGSGKMILVLFLEVYYMLICGELDVNGEIMVSYMIFLICN